METLKKGDNTITTTKGLNLEKSAFNSSNCKIIHDIQPPFKSWNPNHSLNSLLKLEKGKQYLIRLTDDVELLGKL